MGTAMGGGFLALPYTTASCGLVPSSVGLLGTWLFLLLEAFVVSDLVLSNSGDSAASLPAIASKTFPAGGVKTFLALVNLALLLTTLVSQVCGSARGRRLRRHI